MGAKSTNSTYLPDFTVGEIVTSFGQNVGWQISKYNIPAIWAETEGEGITIAVLDTGCQLGHPDLSDSLIPGFSFPANAGRRRHLKDVAGHGTHCCGVISANNDAQGIVGVAPKAKILVIKVLGDDGSGTYDWVQRGVEYAIGKVDIISMSLGGPEGFPPLHDAIKKAYDANIPVICAAGNSGNVPVAYPARYPEAISIGALTDQNIRAEFSQTGAMLDFMAPGVSIQSTYPNNRYEYLSGTSMATPWAAGVVALMMAKHRQIGGSTPLNTVEDVREHLKKTAIDLDVAGKDPKTGYGLVDVRKAVESITAPTPEPEPIAPAPEPEPTPEPPAPEPEPTPPDSDLTSELDTIRERLDAAYAAISDLQARVQDLETRIAAAKNAL